MRARVDWIEQVATLTGARERSAVDAALVKLLVACLAPRRIGVHEVLDTPSGPRLLLQARWESGRDGVELPGHQVDRAASFPLTQVPGAAAAWWEAMEGRFSLVQNRTLWLTVRTEVGAWRLLEIAFDAVPDPEQRDVANALADLYRNHLDLLDYAERDTLTGLLNRRSFDDAFYLATQAESEAGAPLSSYGVSAQSSWLVLIDVDHFKRVNDEFGHLIGDEVLLLLAGLMRKNFRHVDRLFRFGGEEFVVLLHCLDADAAEHALERFRQTVEGYAFPQVGRVTVSVGVTRVQRHDTPSAAFERADEVVYLAKAQGRNQVRCYEDPSDGGEPAYEVRESSVELF